MQTLWQCCCHCCCCCFYSGEEGTTEFTWDKTRPPEICRGAKLSICMRHVSPPLAAGMPVAELGISWTAANLRWMSFHVFIVVSNFICCWYCCSSPSAPVPIHPHIKGFSGALFSYWNLREHEPEWVLCFAALPIHPIETKTIRSV